MAQEAFGPKPLHIVDTSIVSVTEAEYDNAALVQIVHRRTASFGPGHRDYVNRHIEQILKQIRNPYALTMLLARIEGSSTLPDIDVAIADSQVDFIGHTLAKEVKEGGRTAVSSAALLWLSFMLGGVSQQSATRLREFAIQGGAAAGDLDPRGLLGKLLSSGWFDSRETKVTAHPTQIQGLESLFTDNTTKTIAEDAIIAALNGMVAAGELKVATAAARKLVSRKLPIPNAVRDSINQFVVQRCNEAEPQDFADRMRDVAELSNGSDPVSMLIRALSTRRGSQGFMDNWQAPTWTEQEAASVSTSAEARQCAVRFIQEGLPDSALYEYGASFIDFIANKLKWDFSAEFEKAYEKALERGSSASDVLLAGALRQQSPPYDRLLAAAFSAHDAASESHADITERHRQAEQGELDALESNHIFEQPGENYFASEQALSRIVNHRRRTDGYTWILAHPRSDDLKQAWIKSLMSTDKADEFQAAWTASTDYDRRVAWGVAGKLRVSVLKPVLLDETTSVAPEHLRELITAISATLEDEEWDTQFLPIARALSADKRLMIATTLLNLDSDSKQAEAIHSTATALLNEDEWTFCQAMQNDDDDELTHDSLTDEFLGELAESELAAVALRACAILLNRGVARAETIRSLLTNDDRVVRQHASWIARHELLTEIRPELRKNLEDADYRVRRHAMVALATRADIEEQTAIIAMHQDRSGPVKKTLAEIIGFYKWAEGVPALITLLDDPRNSNAQGGLMKEAAVGGPQYKVARAAAEALGNMRQLSLEEYQTIVDFIEEGTDRCDDVFVRYHATRSISTYLGEEDGTPFTSWLNDSQFAAGTKNAGYPVRYAAACALAGLLIEAKDARNSLEPKLLLESAQHSDWRLAGPALLCLGMMLPKSAIECDQALGAESPANRAALVLIGAAIVGASAPTLASRLELTALGALTAAAVEHTSWTRSDWDTFLTDHPEIAEWLATASADADLGECISWSLQVLAPALLASERPHWPSARHLPEVMGVMNLWTMAGGE